MKRVFICSRYRGHVEYNTAVAKHLCAKAVREGHSPFAPHLFYTQFLDDNIESERKAGIACGACFLRICNEVWVYAGDGVSEGMRAEIAYAKAKGIPVIEVEL